MLNFGRDDWLVCQEKGEGKETVPSCHSCGSRNPAKVLLEAKQSHFAIFFTVPLAIFCPAIFKKQPVPFSCPFSIKVIEK
jgi:hypothetical protein